MNELKPCPFCKRKMAVEYKIVNQKLRYGIVHANKWFDYFNDRCYGGTDFEFKTEEEAVEAWNGRTKDDDTRNH